MEEVKEGACQRKVVRGVCHHGRTLFWVMNGQEDLLSWRVGVAMKGSGSQPKRQEDQFNEEEDNWEVNFNSHLEGETKPRKNPLWGCSKLVAIIKFGLEKKLKSSGNQK